MRYRIEKDNLGECQIPAEAYYGIYTLRCKDNFNITKRGLPRQFIKGLALIKKAAAQTNQTMGYISSDKAKAIMLSCDEILNGRLHGQFITDLMQGGSGIAMDMNACEVIANRANEMLGGKKGVYDLVNPIKDVNLNITTSDTIITMGKIACIRQAKKLLVEIKKLNQALTKKINELNDTKLLYIDTSNKQLNFIDLSQKVKSLDNILDRDYKNIVSSLDSFYDLNFTDVDNDTKFSKKMITNLSKFATEDFKYSKSLIETQHNIDCFVKLSDAVKALDINVSKNFNDLVYLIKNTINDFTEIIVPQVQSYPDTTQDFSSFDIMNQVTSYTIGLSTTIDTCIKENNLNNHVSISVILIALFDILNTSRRAIRTLKEKIIDNISFKVNYPIDEEVIKNINNLQKEMSIYAVIDLYNQAIKENKNIKDLIK